MDPIALIMTALVAGAKASLGRIADRTISSLYERLLEKIRGRLAATFNEAKATETQQALTDPKAVDDPDKDMEAMLRTAKIHRDPEIVDLARQLVEALRTREAGAPGLRQQVTADRSSVAANTLKDSFAGSTVKDVRDSFVGSIVQGSDIRIGGGKKR